MIGAGRCFLSRPRADFDRACRSNFNAQRYQARRLNALDGAHNVTRCEAFFRTTSVRDKFTVGHWLVRPNQ